MSRAWTITLGTLIFVATISQGSEVSTVNDSSLGAVKDQGAKAGPALKEGQISATPRLIRSQPETEIFFKDFNQSLIIPKDNKHNKIFEAVSKAMKGNSKITLEVDLKTRRVLGIPEEAPVPQGEAVPPVLEKNR